MKTQTLRDGSTRYIGLGVLAGSSLTLTREASRRYEDGGPDGDRYRRELGNRILPAIAGDHDRRTITVYAYAAGAPFCGGVTLEVYDFAEDA